MKKLILSLAAAAIVASGFGAYKAYQSYQPKNNLLAMNLEALAQGEGTGSEADSETYQEVKATRTEQTTTGAGLELGCFFKSVVVQWEDFKKVSDKSNYD